VRALLPAERRKTMIRVGGCELVLEEGPLEVESSPTERSFADNQWVFTVTQAVRFRWRDLATGELHDVHPAQQSRSHSPESEASAADQ
jgi:hypothetical protein